MQPTAHGLTTLACPRRDNLFASPGADLWSGHKDSSIRYLTTPPTKTHPANEHSMRAEQVTRAFSAIRLDKRRDLGLSSVVVLPEAFFMSWGFGIESVMLSSARRHGRQIKESSN